MSDREVDSRRPSLLKGLEARWIGIGIAATALVTGLAAKAVGVATFAEAPIDVPGPLDLRLVLNSGVAFGMGARLPSGLVVGVTAAVTVGIGVMLWRGRLPAVAGGLILGGAIANVVDRMGDGAVVDVFDLVWFPAFNLADVWITVGVALTVLLGSHVSGPSRSSDEEVELPRN